MYLSVNMIYLGWYIFAKTSLAPIADVEIKYEKRHVYICKDIKCCFRVVIYNYGIIEKAIESMVH